MCGTSSVVQDANNGKWQLGEQVQDRHHNDIKIYEDCRKFSGMQNMEDVFHNFKHTHK